MTRSVSVVVPVRDGERYLAELLDAVCAQAGDAASLEVLVVDSGSTDGSVAIARAAGAQVLEIPPETFGHGRTRNLAAEHTSGELIVFLTQDATPVPGWLAGLQAGFDAGERVGAVYGPHLPRPDTSPMIARELTHFFAGHEDPERPGEPVVQRGDEWPFLSNVNAAYRRDCWAQVRFADVPYSEDQAFARAMLAAGWEKAYVPAAGVRHAHDYPPAEFRRRYFDEYRGLRESAGHVERFRVGGTVRDVRTLVAADRAFMAEHGVPERARTRWTATSVAHHTGRKVFAALGSHAYALPPGVQRRLSLEGTVVTEKPADLRPPWPPADVAQVPDMGAHLYDIVLRYEREGAAPLLPPLSGQDADRPLHVACVIPPFQRGSGGHGTIFQILHRLEQRGHTVSVWLDDPADHMKEEWPGYLRGNIREWFSPIEGPVERNYARWRGADVVMATGWQTAHQVMLLGDVRARAYFVQDHEPEFFPTSAESLWAAQTYRMGMHAICASPWLADVVGTRYGASTSSFLLGVDHDVYAPQDIARQEDTVLVYGRDVTPRRAVPLAFLALEEVRRRRPQTRIQAFGNQEHVHAPFAYEHLGILSPEQLAWAYSQATVGLVLGLTNYSLIPQEMLACGLPAVDLAGTSAAQIFGADGPVALAEPSPLALADAIIHLLDDPDERERRRAAGIAYAAERTWDDAADRVEEGLREALRLRAP